MIWTRHHREEMHKRVVRLLRAELVDTRKHAADLAEQLVSARQAADVAHAEVELAREELAAGHRELRAENTALREANRLLHRQLNDAMGYGPSDLAVIDAGGKQALAALEKAPRLGVTVTRPAGAHTAPAASPEIS
jgi:hypothetical protein